LQKDNTNNLLFREGKNFLESLFILSSEVEENQTQKKNLSYIEDAKNILEKNLPSSKHAKLGISLEKEKTEPEEERKIISPKGRQARNIILRNMALSTRG